MGMALALEVSAALEGRQVLMNGRRGSLEDVSQLPNAGHPVELKGPPPNHAQKLQLARGHSQRLGASICCWSRCHETMLSSAWSTWAQSAGLTHKNRSAESNC